MVEKSKQLPVFPSAQEMQNTLRQSGILEKSTVFPDTSTPGMESASQLQQVALAHAGTAETNQVDLGFDFSLAKRYIPKIVGVLLTLQGLKGIYDSIYFILVEFPQLEMALNQHLVTTQEINNFAAKAAITAISTIISMIFALRLTIFKTKAAKVLSTIIGIGLILGNTLIQQYFAEVNSGVIFSDYSAVFLEETSRSVEELIPLE